METPLAARSISVPLLLLKFFNCTAEVAGIHQAKAYADDLLGDALLVYNGGGLPPEEADELDGDDVGQARDARELHPLGVAAELVAPLRDLLLQRLRHDVTKRTRARQSITPSESKTYE